MTKTSITFFGHLSKIPNRLSWLPILRSPRQKTNAKNGKREKERQEKGKFGACFDGLSVRFGSSLLEVDMSKREKCLTNKQLRGPPNCLQLLFWLLLPPDVAEPSFMMSLGAFDLFLCTFFGHKLVDTLTHRLWQT